MQGELRALNQLEDNEQNNAEDAEGAKHHEDLKCAVSKCGVAAIEEKKADG